MNTVDHQVAILLGSNILPEVYLTLALQKLNQILHPIAISSAWESPAIGSTGPNFLNAIGIFATDLDRDILKYKMLRPLEAELGRVRQDDKFAPRTIDLDILVWDGVVQEANMWRYSHIMLPFTEIMELLNPEIKLEHIMQEFRGVIDLRDIHRRGDVLQAKLTAEHPQANAFRYLPSSISLSAKLMKSSTAIAPGFSPERMRSAT